jgi:hypothetical protein
MVPPGGPPDQNEITTSIIHYHVDIPISDGSHWYMLWQHPQTLTKCFCFLLKISVIKPFDYCGCCRGRSKFEEHACCRIPWPVPADTNNLTRVFLSKLHEAYEVLGKCRLFLEHHMFTCYGLSLCITALLEFLSQTYFFCGAAGDYNHTWPDGSERKPEVR